MRTKKRFRPYDPGAPIPVPTDLRDWLPEDHLVYFVSDLIDDEDLSRYIL